MKGINRINRMLEMPKEAYTNEPKVVIIGFNELIIENYKGILEYEEYYIKLSTFIGCININGFNLKLDKMTEDSLKVIGKIESLDIERQIE
ncbi:MAG: YabP/YqfC family sporulation protein [Clostridia bacterium]|nr:YabP/YqfC family sporulation protein [Clostridia bacterium]